MLAAHGYEHIQVDVSGTRFEPNHGCYNAIHDVQTMYPNSLL